ncbi:hypothetical protein [Microvirga sp. VF16]|uniref:hypothetical protein n=1 Tax=Microvirga sp. VF16 TaxID=2807101 RepID=UPI00193CBFE2|nr:hypothetical protein [Microvirga sp. VF16]QRM34895.1 hypothetical protein JO965_42305 [Microvirga sp. VF16]
MSANFIDKLHIDVLVSGAIDLACTARLVKGGALLDILPENGEQLGKILWAENARSVNYLDALLGHGSNPALDEIVGFYGFEYRPNLCPTVVSKALVSYEHQACECPDYPETVAYDFASRLARRLIKKLPGWEKAPWGIERPEQIAVRFA